MDKKKKAWIVGVVVILAILVVKLPLEGRVTHRYSLDWVPNEEDPTVLAAYIEREIEVEEVDQLYLLRVFVEEEGYNAYFFHKAKDGNAVATWLVHIPAPDEIILKHEEEMTPKVGLRITDTAVEYDMLYATTGFNEKSILVYFLLSIVAGLVVGAVAYDIMKKLK